MINNKWPNSSRPQSYLNSPISEEQFKFPPIKDNDGNLKSKYKF